MCRIGRLCGVLLLCAMIFGCGRQPPAPPPAKPPEVIVSLPVVKEVTDFEDFTGRTDAVATVQVRARVSGYLDKILFTEGREVKEGDPLFEIDPRTYQDDLDQKESTVAQAEAHFKRLDRDYGRAAKLLPDNAVSQTEFDQIMGDRDEAAAALKVAKAAAELSHLNLSFTKVAAPLSGRIGKQMIDPGNMVQADQTVLTTIVSQDPIYAYFAVDERTTLKIRRLIRAGVVKPASVAPMPVLLGLSDEKGYPHEGTVDFVDNRTDAMTGTLYLRGIFKNPKRILSPGLFARIRLPVGEAHQSLAISEAALGSDQGQKFVYVVNDKNEVEYRRVKIGIALSGGLRSIDEGLKETDRVVVAGLQRIRPGIKVEPKSAEATAAAGSAPPAATQPEAAPGAQSPAAPKPEADRAKPEGDAPKPEADADGKKAS
jgi:RND family efflux transporter MFP subunit